MSRPRSRIRAFVLACAAFGAFAAQARAYDVFPLTRVFRPLLADPREIQLSASYYRLQGHNDADVALGHSWGMARWASANGSWLLQWDIEGMAYSRFQVSGGVNKFETVDFFANLPLEVKHGAWAGKFYLYHESSHLGDDYIRDTGNTGFRYSVEGVRAVVSDDIFPHLRIYGGGDYLFHSIPTPQRGTLQGGFEITGPDFQWRWFYSVRPYLAEDVQSHANVQWNVNSNSVLGLRFDFPNTTRAMRASIGYFAGHSPYGQFYSLPEHYAYVGLGFDL
ncbi:MAG TPA: DUF1207 domain-containing protein [Elusimicrobiota bacterium]|nr:DUF1207 domain-containing protein [Elusimicrobiota bacterium]